MFKSSKNNCAEVFVVKFPRHFFAIRLGMYYRRGNVKLYSLHNGSEVVVLRLIEVVWCRASSCTSLHSHLATIPDTGSSCLKQAKGERKKKMKYMNAQTTPYRKHF